MRLVLSANMHYWLSATVLVMAISSLGCTQTPIAPAPATSQLLPSTLKGKTMAGPATNRIMARLDGLSGEADPRVPALKNRIAQLGMTVVSIGVAANPSAGQATAPSSFQFTAFIVVAIDRSKVDLDTALAQMRSLETFAYVEADQLLQKR